MSGKRMPRWGTVPSVVAGLALLLAAPVEANWLARGSAVLGVGYALKRNLGDGIDLMGEALDAAMHGDGERVREIGEEIEALPGRLIRDTFPVFKVGAGVRDAAVAAREKLTSAAGRIPRLRSEALGRMASSRERLQSVTLKVRRYYGDADQEEADPRMALAVDEEDRALVDADTKVPDEPALAAVPAPTAIGDEDAEARASEALGWDDVVSSEGEDQAVEAAAKGSDPWAADEDGTRSSGWDEEPVSGGMQVAQVEVEETSVDEVIEDDGDDYTGALNALLSDDAADGGESSAGGKAVAGEAGEAAANVTQAAGTRSDAVEKSKWPPGKKFRDCAECPEMVVVPAGSFMMGSPASDREGRDHERPVHRVTIGKVFAVGVYEVTFDEWDACGRSGECKKHSPEYRLGSRGSQPVIYVSWDDAQAHVRWLSGETGTEYRLLSESEWEYMARARTTTRYWWGDDIGRNRANCLGCGSRWDYYRMAPVGSFPANGFGVHDVHGNVEEWVGDCWHDGYRGAPSDGGAWTDGGECSWRVLRGGTNSNSPGNIRSASRDRAPPEHRSAVSGFRVARTLTP